MTEISGQFKMSGQFQDNFAISGEFQISGQLCNFRNFRTAGTPADYMTTKLDQQFEFFQISRSMERNFS